MSWIRGCCGGCGGGHKESEFVEKFLKEDPEGQMIEEIKTEGLEVLGEGSFGIVLDYDENHVLKVCKYD